MKGLLSFAASEVKHWAIAWLTLIVAGPKHADNYRDEHLWDDFR